MAAPRAIAELAESAPWLPPGTDDRISGYGVMGLSFESGDLLALRCMTAASFAPGYRSIWHRNPAGEWRVFSTAEPDKGCERFIGADCSYPSHQGPIEVTWLDDNTLRIRVEGALDWTVATKSTPVTRVMTFVGGLLPHWMWVNRGVLGLMGRIAGPVLKAGRIRLRGVMPNGQHFTAATLKMWVVADSRAMLDGRDLGRPKALAHQARTGTFWLPQTGIVMRGYAHFDAFDPAIHVDAVERQEELLARVA